MSVFKRRRFPTEVILVRVRWYCKYGISYRDLAEMMQARGVMMDHTTIFRSVQRYAPEIEKRVRWHQGYRSPSWRVDETYVRVGGAVDKTGSRPLTVWCAVSPIAGYRARAPSPRRSCRCILASSVSWLVPDPQT